MRKYIGNALIVLASFVLLFLILEVITRRFLEAPPSVIITNLGVAHEMLLGMPGESARSLPKSSTDFLPSENIYLNTSTGYRLRKNASGVLSNRPLSGMDVEFRTNELGFRGPSFVRKTPEDFRILILGDSITLADYLPEADTFPARTEKYLRQSRSSALTGKRVQVINGGVASVDLQSEFAVLMETGLTVRPDVVLVGLYLNDAYVSPTIEMIRLPTWLKWSHFVRLIMDRVGRLKANYGVEKLAGGTKRTLTEEFFDFYRFRKVPRSGLKSCCRTDEEFNGFIAKFFWDWGYAWSEDYWQKVTEILSLMKEVSRDRNFTLAVVFLPVSYQVESPVLKNEPQVRFEQEMTKLKIPHLDLLPVLRAKFQADQTSLFYDQCHYRMEGNDFVGKTIANFLIEKVIGKQGNAD